jgi:hypothetical protein
MIWQNQKAQRLFSFGRSRVLFFMAVLLFLLPALSSAQDISPASELQIKLPPSIFLDLNSELNNIENQLNGNQKLIAELQILLEKSKAETQAQSALFKESAKESQNLKARYERLEFWSKAQTALLLILAGALTVSLVIR